MILNPITLWHVDGILATAARLVVKLLIHGTKQMNAELQVIPVRILMILSHDRRHQAHVLSKMKIGWAMVVVMMALTTLKFVPGILAIAVKRLVEMAVGTNHTNVGRMAFRV